MNRCISNPDFFNKLRILLVSLCLMIGAESLYAQGWERIYGGDLYNTADFVIPTQDGHYLVSGESADALGTGGYSLYLQKITVDGDLVWQNFYEPIPSLSFLLEESDDSTYILRRYEYYEVNNEEYRKVVIEKINADGELIWSYILSSDTEEENWVYNMVVKEDGSIIFNGLLGASNYFIASLDDSGNLVYLNSLASEIDGSIMTEGSDDTYYFTEVFSGDYISIFKTDAFGIIIETLDYPEIDYIIEQIFLHPDNGFVLIKNLLNNENVAQVRLDDQGNVVSIDTIISESAVVTRSSILEDGFISTGWTIPSPSEALLIKTDFDGNIIWTKRHNHLSGFQIGYDVSPALDSGFIVAGIYNPGAVELAYVFKTDENGNIYTNAVSGKIAIDETDDCTIDPNESSIEDWVVTAQKGDITFVGTSGSNGEYVIPIDTGDYTVSVRPVSDYWESCINDINIVVSNLDSILNIDFPIETIIECPLMAINHSVPTIRPCFERPSYVNYCNYGTVTADSAYIDITYDSLINPVSASIIWDSLGDNIYRFHLGDLAPLECGSFTVNLFLDCDAEIGASYCIGAHAYPDTICDEPSQSWSGAFIEVSAACESDSIYFRIDNVGDGAMDQPSKYIIVEDIVLLKRDSVELPSGEFDTKSVVANGSTYTILAEQVPNAPGMTFPMAVIEGCGENEDGEFSVGLSNQFPLDDSNPFLDVDCPVAVSSFDPNDKRGFPLGYGEEHFIRPEVPIEYMIRFQNTGTDTAFAVVIRDTLDSQFDVTTFRAGASSHAYDYAISGQGVLSFTFENIMLPDSNVNEVASNGFVEYLISSKADLELGSVLRNRAAIYFDFNEPVITNETFHTLGEEFVEIMVGITNHPTIENISVEVRPNPFGERAEIKIENYEGKDFLLEIFDVSGKLVRKEIHNTSPIIFYKKGLNNGLYFYRLSTNDGFLNTGKIIISGER